MDIVNSLLIIFSALLAVPTMMFSLQVLFALGKTELSSRSASRQSRVAVLVPAHNEAAVITSTLNSIVSQLGDNDVLLVVADNCTDNTADLATLCGVKVIERKDVNKRGKGYALDFGLQYLAGNNPPEIVIIIDADCHLSENCIDILAQQAEAEQRPVQALYLMNAPSDKSITQAIAEFAWIVKNHVRPLGLKRFNLPCQLMGTGMAFPWKLLSQADLAHGNMVEDMKLGIDLAVQGSSPTFCPSALVSSKFPIASEITNEQRKRWEHGHLATILSETPKLLKSAIKQRDVSLLFMALDLSVPPLSLLGVCLIVMLSMTALLAFFSAHIIPFVISLNFSALFAVAVLVAWYRFGREILAFKTLRGVPFYVLRKIPLYIAFLLKRQQGWVKTERR